MFLVRLGQSESVESAEEVLSAVDLVVQTIEERLPDDQRTAVGLGVRRLFSRVKSLSDARLLLNKKINGLRNELARQCEEIAHLKKQLELRNKGGFSENSVQEPENSKQPTSGVSFPEEVDCAALHQQKSDSRQMIPTPSSTETEAAQLKQKVSSRSADDTVSRVYYRVGFDLACIYLCVGIAINQRKN